MAVIFLTDNEKDLKGHIVKYDKNSVQKYIDDLSIKLGSDVRMYSPLCNDIQDIERLSIIEEKILSMDTHDAFDGMNYGTDTIEKSRVFSNEPDIITDMTNVLKLKPNYLSLIKDEKFVYYAIIYYETHDKVDLDEIYKLYIKGEYMSSFTNNNGVLTFNNLKLNGNYLKYIKKFILKFKISKDVSDVIRYKDLCDYIDNEIHFGGFLNDFKDKLHVEIDNYFKTLNKNAVNDKKILKLTNNI